MCVIKEAASLDGRDPDKPIPMPWYDTTHDNIRYYNASLEHKEIIIAAQIGIAAVQSIAGVISEIVDQKSMSLYTKFAEESSTKQQQICVGDRIQVDRKLYKHYAIVGDIGKGGVKCWHFADVNFKKGIVNPKCVKGECTVDPDKPIPMPWYDTTHDDSRFYNASLDRKEIIIAAQIGIAATEIIAGVISEIVVQKSMSLYTKFAEETSTKQQQICIGDRIQVDRKLYKHYAIVEDIGKDGVKCWHFADVNFKKGIVNPKCVKGEVRMDNLQDIVKNDRWRIDNSLDSKYKTFDPDKIVVRARSKLGQTDYNLFTNNCETYANWCRNGEEKSDQVRNFVVGASVTAAVVTIAAAGTAAASSRAHTRNE